MARLSMHERIVLIDPENITLDTVKLLFPFTPKWFCRLILGTAVRRGEFERKPDGSCRLVGETQC